MDKNEGNHVLFVDVPNTAWPGGMLGNTSESDHFPLDAEEYPYSIGISALSKFPILDHQRFNQEKLPPQNGWSSVGVADMENHVSFPGRSTEHLLRV
ncbi:MAG: hypothetical protein AAGA75_11640 [Cyanobacteria bacterium P01_E01_bin.6]